LRAADLGGVGRRERGGRQQQRPNAGAATITFAALAPVTVTGSPFVVEPPFDRSANAEPVRSFLG